jgi:hypothetical protein
MCSLVVELTPTKLPQGCTPNIISYHWSKVASCSRHLYVMVCTTNTIDHTFYPISTIFNSDHIFSNLVLLIGLVNICLLVVESNGNVQKLTCVFENKISNKVTFFFYVFCPNIKLCTMCKTLLLLQWMISCLVLASPILVKNGWIHIPSLHLLWGHNITL